MTKDEIKQHFETLTATCDQLHRAVYDHFRYNEESVDRREFLDVMNSILKVQTDLVELGDDIRSYIN